MLLHLSQQARLAMERSGFCDKAATSSFIEACNCMQVMPSDVGQRQPLYFFLLPTYWKPNQAMKGSALAEEASDDSPLMGSTGSSSAALSCPALSCPALPHPALPCNAQGYAAPLCPSLLCSATMDPALPCPALSCPALPCPALPSLPCAA